MWEAWEWKLLVTYALALACVVVVMVVGTCIVFILDRVGMMADDAHAYS